jgi:hypothetical protein
MKAWRSPSWANAVTRPAGPPLKNRQRLGGTTATQDPIVLAEDERQHLQVIWVILHEALCMACRHLIKRQIGPFGLATVRPPCPGARAALLARRG